MSIEPVTILPLVISQYPTYHLEATSHTHMSSFKPFVHEVRECSSPSTSEHKEDNLAPLNLVSLPSDVKEGLQSVIMSEDLDLDELDPDQVNMSEAWEPMEVVKQIWRTNFMAVEDQDQVMD